MASVGKIKIAAVKVISDLTVKVLISGLRRTRIRLRLGGWFIKLGCRIAGTQCEIETVDILPKVTDYPPMPKCKPPKQEGGSIIGGFAAYLLRKAGLERYI